MGSICKTSDVDLWSTRKPNLDKSTQLCNSGVNCVQGGDAGRSDPLPLALEWIIFQIVFDVNFESIIHIQCSLLLNILLPT